MKFSCTAAAVLVSAVSSVISLGGCAGTQGASGGAASKADIVTESDEPENRRRARLRLELASGYFEQGQINVALDEVKDRKSVV